MKLLEYALKGHFTNVGLMDNTNTMNDPGRLVP